MEASPGYFYGGRKTAEEIKSVCGNIKILIILRNPTDRLVSFFNRKREMLFLSDKMTLTEYVDQCNNFSESDLVKEENHLYTGVVFGEYIKHLNDWVEVFGDNLKIAFFEELKNPKAFMQNLSTWLNVDARFYDTYDFNIENKSGGFKNKLMHRVAVKASFGLQKFWRYNRGLKKFLKSVYYNLNRSNVKSNIKDEEAVAKLNKHYEPFNKQLAAYLKTKGYANLPQWLVQ